MQLNDFFGANIRKYANTNTLTNRKTYEKIETIAAKEQIYLGSININRKNAWLVGLVKGMTRDLSVSLQRIN